MNAFAFFECLGFECPGFEWLGFEFDTRRTEPAEKAGFRLRQPEPAEKAGFRLRQAGYVTGRTFVGAQVS
jgi:hypothetical protein